MKLPLLFSEAFDAPIWEMHLNGHLLLISTRNQEKLEVAFNLFDLSTNAFLWKDIVFEEPWWIGVSHFHGDVWVFHTYANSQDLEQKSIFGFNSLNMEVIWSFDQTNPIQLNGENIICTKSDEAEKTFISINVKNGKVAAIEELPKFYPRKSNLSIPNSCYNPLHYVEGSSGFEAVARFLGLKFNLKIIGACDYLEYQNRIVVSFFEKNEQENVNTLVILDESMEMIDSFVLDSEIKGLASDTFFIVNEALIFVRNRNLLVGVLILN